MSPNPTRLRALAMIGLAAVVLVTTLPAQDTRASEGPSGPDPSGAVGASATPAPTPTVPPTPGTVPAPAATADPTPAATADPTPAATADPAPPAPPDVVPASSVVVAFARSHLRARYRHDGTGPTSFDCSGLMWRVFHEAGLGRKVSGRSARAIYLSYRRRGLASRHDPQVGDLIVWGRGSHVGVYIGRGYAISALIQGVRVHRVRAMFTPFTAYLHTHLAGLEMPAWELQLARHARSLRHATRTVFLHEAASRASATAGTLRNGTRLVVLARRRDGRHRLWLEVLTFSGRTGWVPAAATAR